nr:unnamed protein product [Callosobruchus chinensis]
MPDSVIMQIHYYRRC